MYLWKLKEILKDKNFWKGSWVIPGASFVVATTILSFFDFENESIKIYIFIGLVIGSILWIVFSLILSYRMKEVKLDIDGSEIEIVKGDIFTYPRNVYKVIAFNEFFDTVVDDKIISSSSLNGQYLNKFHLNVTDLDEKILHDDRMQSRIIEKGVSRPLGGKTTRFRLGSVYKDMDFFLVAFSKFNDENEANLKLHEYANCLINFWNEINILYAQKEVIVPLLGSGITRHQDFDATPHQLLEVMILTFKISKVKFKEPSKITIVLHESQYKKVNFYKLKEFEENGL